MASAETELWGLAGQIEPTQAQKEGAATSHNNLRALLRTGNFANRIVNDYLSGSYARDTAIRPIDDVDIIFEINAQAWPNAGTILYGKPKPSTVLESFANAIRYRYPVSSVFGQRRSVRLQLYHLDIDVVPAIRDAAVTDMVFIPDRDSDDWIKSSPKRHAANATAINSRRSGMFKPLVKILKYWNGNLPSTATFKSFAIETIAAHLFNGIAVNSLQEGLTHFFDFVVKVGGGVAHYNWANTYGVSLGFFYANVPDLAGTGTNVVGRLDASRRNKFVEAARVSRDRMLQAHAALAAQTAVNRVREALRG
jgi:hypothetical protein